jgi:uncharacterized RDD family membrane protein YckC
MAPIDELLTIDTPENVSFDFEIAGIGSRFIAALVDTLIILLLQILAFAVGLVAILSIDQFSGSIGSYLQDNLATALAISGLIGFLFLWGYYIFFELAWNGSTPGKHLARLRVIRVDGRPITLSESLVRNLVRVIDFMPGFYGVGVVTMFLSSQSRRLGDLAAGTLVVHEKAKTINLESLEAPAVSVTSASNISIASLNLPLDRLSAADFNLVEEFLLRYKQMSNPEVMGHHLLNHLWQKMELPGETFPRQSAVDVLAAIYNRK